MKLTRIITTTPQRAIVRALSIALILLAAIVPACTNAPTDEPPAPPVTPQFSPTSVEVQIGQSAEITITKGTPAYTATSAQPTIATATVSGSKITVTGISAGTATIQVAGSDKGAASFVVTVNAPPDPYADFKADATPRFEWGSSSVIKNGDPAMIFYVDRSAQLFSSPYNKFGYSSRNGLNYYFVEWEGDDSVGPKTNARQRTQSAVGSIQSFQIIKSEGGTVWIVFQPDATSPEVRVVQKW